MSEDRRPGGSVADAESLPSVDITHLAGAEGRTFVEVPQGEDLQAAAAAEILAEEEAELEAVFQGGRPAIATAFAVLAVAVMIGGMFSGWQARLFAGVGGLEGVLLGYYVARSRRPWAAQGMALVGEAALVLAACIAAPTGFKDLSHMPSLIQQAAAAGHILRPPAPFDPGWRPIITALMAFIGFAASWIAIEFRKPQLGLLIPLPVTIYAAISQAPSAQIPDGIAAFALMAVGLTVLFRDTGGESGGGLSLEFEARRAMRSLPLLAGAVVVLILLAQSHALFPAPAYDPTQAAQLPHPVPLSAASDKPLFLVKSSITGPWRTGVLDVYDGSAFRLPPYAQSRFKHIGLDGNIDPILQPGVDAEFQVKQLDGVVLPIPTRPVIISEVGNQLYYDDRTGTIRLAEGNLQTGIDYRVTAAAPPTDAQLKDAGPDLRQKVDLQVPAVPPAVTRFLVGAPASGWARADWVRKKFLQEVTLTGAGLPEVVPPSKVVDMLEGSKEGSPYDIVAGEVLLERWAGIPARIGYGYDKGDTLPGTGGWMEVRPRHGSSWLEVDFKGLGWFPVTGAPLHAKGSVGSKNIVNTNQNVLPSDQIAVSLFIPIRQITPALLYEQLRPLFLALIGALALGGFLFSLWPALAKLWRRSRRKAWALRMGPRARIAVAYAEFRELCTDLGDDHHADPPLAFLDHVADDPEHEEFAWLVARKLWGIGPSEEPPNEDDVHAAEELSASLRTRISRAQPWSVRLLAIVSRLSLRHPYTLGVSAPGEGGEEKLREINLRLPSLASVGHAGARVPQIALVLLTIVSTSACFGVGAQESVLVKTVSSDMAFGAPPSASAGSQSSAPQIGPSLGFGFGFPTPFNIGGPGPTGLCPLPGFDVFPLDPASPDVENRPVAGTYQYRESGTEKLAIANVINISIPLSIPLITRKVHAVAGTASPALAAVNSGAFSFLDDGGFGLQFLDPKLTAGYESLPNGTDVNTLAPPPVPQQGYPTPVPSPLPSNPPNYQFGASADGVYLTSLSFSTPPPPVPVPGAPSSPTTFTFHVVPAAAQGATGPSPAGVQLMQVPALNRQQWSSGAADSTDGTSIAFSGGINGDGTHGSGKEFLNGCGEVFDSWRVDGTLTLSGPGTAITDTVTFWFATQYGGLLLAEQHNLTHAVLGAYDFSGTNFTIALNHLKPVSG